MLPAISEREPVQFSPPYVIPWGANYVTRAREQARHRYDPDLGYRPGGRSHGKKPKSSWRCWPKASKAGGCRARQCAITFPKARQTTKYLRTTFTIAVGTSGASNGINPTVDCVFGRPPWLWKQAASAELKYRLHRVWSAPDVWVEHLITSSESWGILRDYTPKLTGLRS